jgi:hypothetical protein
VESIKVYYILIGTEDNRTVYQEVYRGTVQRITDLTGNTVPDLTVPHWVLDSNPVQPAWALPDPPEPVPQRETVLTRLDFRNKFTYAEKVQIYTAAISDFAVKILLDDLAQSSYVDLQDPKIIDALSYLVSIGAVTEVRKQEILNA